jgi:hypothetical protein
MIMELSKERQTLHNTSFSNTLKSSAFFIGFGVDMLKGGVNTKSIPDGEDRNLFGLMKYSSFPFLWRKMAEVTSIRSQKKAAFSAFATNYELASRYDDMIDEYDALQLTPAVLKKDKKAALLLSKIIRQVKQSPAIDDQKRKFLRDYGNFRRMEYDLYRGYEMNPSRDTSFEAVKKYKEDTGGLNGRMGAKLCWLYSPAVSDEVAEKIETAFANICLYYQVGDDKVDLRSDMNINTPNFFIAALQSFPDELKRTNEALRQGRSFPSKYLDQIAPQASMFCEEAVNGYRLAISNDFAEYLPILDTGYRVFFKNVK